MTDAYVKLIRRPAARIGAGWMAAAALLIGGAVQGCKPAGGAAAQQAGPMERPPAPVTVVSATAKDVPIYLSEIGRTSPVETVNVQPQVGGRMVQIHFQDGADLKKGDPLFTIDKRWYEANVAEADAAVTQRKAELGLATQEFKRVEGLVAKNAVSQQEFDLRKSQVAVADAQVKAAEAAVETAKLSLEYCTIKSPIDGRAGQRLVDVGNIVQANQSTLLTIQRLDPIYADFTTSERNLPTVRKHLAEGTLKVEVGLPNDPQPPATGELTFLDTMVQPGTGTIKLRATLKNDQKRFWAGQFVEVKLILQVKKDAVLVPSLAVQIGQQGPYVYVVKDDQTAELRPVVTGQRQAELLVVNTGVKAGEKVITTGHMMVMPGAKVNPLPPQGPPAAGGAPAHAAAPATQATTQASAARAAADDGRQKGGTAQ
jgi:multidrug efflux system membrane fusion protein